MQVNHTNQAFDKQWLIPIDYHPERKNTLFMFHHAGGTAASFYSWLPFLNKDISVFAIELPGRTSRFMEKPISDINFISDAIARTILNQATEKIYFYGHSMGGLLVYETARRIHSIQHKLKCIVISGSRPPHIKQLEAPLHSLSDLKLIDYLSQYNVIDSELLANNDIIQIILPFIRSDLEMLYDYKKPMQNLRLNCEIIAIAGLEDPYVNIEDVKNWQQYTSGKFELKSLVGDHFTINEPELVTEIINPIFKKY